MVFIILADGRLLLLLNCRAFLEIILVATVPFLAPLDALSLSWISKTGRNLVVVYSGATDAFFRRRQHNTFEREREQKRERANQNASSSEKMPARLATFK
jgi:hypothetical protein